MRQGMYVFFAIFIALFGLINYYVGLRSWQTVFSRFEWLPGKVYWSAFWVVALSYLVGRMAREWLPDVVAKYFTFVGAYWLAILYYLVLAWLLVDLIRLINRVIPLLPTSLTGHPSYLFIVGTLVLTTVTGIIVYGAWNARHPQVKNYQITVPKSAGDLKGLHIVAVSDLHLGEIMDVGRLRTMVNTINELQPDLVLLPGDIVDEDVGPYIEQEMSLVFKGLMSKYGVIAVPGNHEYIGGQGEEVIKHLRESGITVLRDSYTQVADGSLYIIGREDPTRERFGGPPRKELQEVLRGVDNSKPLIVLDHQPKNLGEAEAQGIDLQLSGHTHRGQFWPNNLITERIYEVDWGYLRKGTLQAVVSLGYGTWGPPIRVGNTPEIIDINLRFK